MARRKRAPPSPKVEEPKVIKVEPPPLGATTCPGCGKDVVLIQLADGCETLCEPQRRLVVFDYEQDEHGLPKGESLSVFEECSAPKLVLGRPATSAERAEYAKTGKIRKPYTIGREGHLKTCSGFGKFLRGEVVQPTFAMLYGSEEAE